MVEPPVDLDAITIHPPIPGSRLPAQGFQVGYSSGTQTLPCEHPDFDFRLIERRSMSGRVVNGESVPDFSAHLGAMRSVVEDFRR